jgi:hypothetical protein
VHEFLMTFLFESFGEPSAILCFVSTRSKLIFSRKIASLTKNQRISSHLVLFLQERFPMRSWVLILSVKITIQHRSASPTVNDMQAVRQVYRYLKATRELCITLGKIQDTTFFAYADASHGDWPDAKSTEGAIWFFGGAPIRWYARKQTIMAPSSTAAEWCALDRPARDAQFSPEEA